VRGAHGVIQFLVELALLTFPDVKERSPRRYSNGMLKTSAQEDLENKKNNSKYDSSLAPKPDSKEKLPALIRGQVEFYFSDSNLPTDDFLWGLTDGASNKPVPLENIMKFGRMKIYEYSDVVPALKESAFLSITGDEGKEKVNRKVAFDPSVEKKAQEEKEARSVYVKGFGDEVPTSQFDIEAFFSPYGPTNAVRLRRTNDKLFKGSVFVEFENEELAKTFLTLDPMPMWKGENVLKVMSKKEYIAIKEQEIKDGKVQYVKLF
jgi:lupus La protein